MNCVQFSSDIKWVAAHSNLIHVWIKIIYMQIMIRKKLGEIAAMNDEI